MSKRLNEPVSFYQWYTIVRRMGEYKAAIDCPEFAGTTGFAAEALRAAIHTDGEVDTHALIETQLAIDDYKQYCQNLGVNK